MEREAWIDSLKGIACVIVFINHFNLTFGSICYGINELIRIEPFNIVTNGNYAVCTFLIISAYLVSSQIVSVKKVSVRFDVYLKQLPSVLYH